MTHICVSKLTTIGSDNGLSPGRHQAIFWTNAGIMFIGSLGTNSSEILSEIYTFSFKKMHLKMSSGKFRPFCLGLSVLRLASILKHQTELRCTLHLLDEYSLYKWHRNTIKCLSRGCLYISCMTCGFFAYSVSNVERVLTWFCLHGTCILFRIHQVKSICYRVYKLFMYKPLSVICTRTVKCASCRKGIHMQRFLLLLNIIDVFRFFFCPFIIDSDRHPLFVNWSCLWLQSMYM